MSASILKELAIWLHDLAMYEAKGDYRKISAYWLNLFGDLAGLLNECNFFTARQQIATCKSSFYEKHKPIVLQ